MLDYVPGDWLVESKSLKLFLGSASAITAPSTKRARCRSRSRLVELLVEPRWLRIGAYWYPRGGIPIDVFWQTGAPPEGVWVPDQGVAPYRGRG